MGAAAVGRMTPLLATMAPIASQLSSLKHA